MEKSEIKKIVEENIRKVKIIDVHTHLYPASFGELALWGPDELITYHYLIAEAVRASRIEPVEFWAKNKKEQADFIFSTLFIERTPISEACRGVLTTFRELGVDLSSMDLDAFREFFDKFTVDEYIDLVFKSANIDKVVMTNDPFDPAEAKCWEDGKISDKRFLAALRIDKLLNDYHSARYDLINMGYDVGRSLNGIAKAEIRRFLKDSIKRMKAVYMAVSLPPSFQMPENTTRNILIEDCVIPVAQEINRPVAMMIGVKRQVNPDLFLASDGVGKANIETIEYLCAKYPKTKFMVTMLSRENQHELCIAARKFRNLYLFGCWWFLNNPSLIEEITRMRMELLGTSFLPQHSDARVLDQLIYKWKHSKEIIAKVLISKYEDLADAGWPLSEASIKKDIKELFGGSFKEFFKVEL